MTRAIAAALVLLCVLLSCSRAKDSTGGEKQAALSSEEVSPSDEGGALETGESDTLELAAATSESGGSREKGQDPAPSETVGAAVPEPVGGWREISLLLTDSVWASSALEEMHGEKKSVYAADNLFDGDRATCWAEGVGGNGVGETITFITNKPVERIGFVNGYARNDSSFERNGRVKAISLSVMPAFTAPGLVSETDYHLYFALLYTAPGKIGLRDSPEMQYVDFPFDEEVQARIADRAMERFLSDHPRFAAEIEKDLDLGAYAGLDEGGRGEYRRLVRAAYAIYCVQIEITDVYPGSSFDDTCISELDVQFY